MSIHHILNTAIPSEISLYVLELFALQDSAGIFTNNPIIIRLRDESAKLKRDYSANVFTRNNRARGRVPRGERVFNRWTHTGTYDIIFELMYQVCRIVLLTDYDV